MSSRKTAMGVALCLSLLAGTTLAQGPSRPSGRSAYSGHLRRPTVSPYLNLFRRDGGGLPNYYTLVRPQINQQQINTEEALRYQALNNQVAEESRRRERESELPATGHPVRYRYFSHFYNRDR